MKRGSDTQTDRGTALKAIMGTFVGFVIGTVVGAVLDPSPFDIYNYGAAVFFTALGAWIGGTGGCYLSLLATGTRRAARIALGVFILLPITTFCAILTGVPIANTVRGTVGAALGVAIALLWVAAAPIGAISGAGMRNHRR